MRRGALGLAAALLLGCAGCATPQSKLADGLYPLRGSQWSSWWGRIASIVLLSPEKIARAYGDEQLTADNAADALADLDEAIALAKEALKDPEVSSPAYHDQTAYVIPLAHLAKAEIHARLHQLTHAEAESWAAIHSSEAYLGQHIKRLNAAARGRGRRRAPARPWRYLRMRCFEGPRSAPPRERRSYTTHFQASTARYIYYELQFSNGDRGRAHRHQVAVTYYRDGTKVGTARSTLAFKKGWTTATHWAGWGAPRAGTWKPGEYAMDVTVDGRHIAEQRFAVADRFDRVPPLTWRGRSARKARLKLRARDARRAARRRGGAPMVAFGSFFVFFRREKIRRQAFALLKEAYRKAGEKDLTALMDAQIEDSDAYLTSKVAHKEEEYVRTIEGADWVAKDKATRTEVKSNLKQVANAVLLVGIIVAGAAASASAEAQANKTKDPQEKARLRAQARLIRAGTAVAAAATVHNMAEVERARRSQLAAIRRELRSTTAVSVARRVRLLSLSPEARQLPAYGALKRKAAELDDYVKRKGFDEDAVRALADLRTSLDELTRQLQKKRTGGP